MWPKVVGGKNAACGPHVFSWPCSNHGEFWNSRWNPGFWYNLPKKNRRDSELASDEAGPWKTHCPPSPPSQPLVFNPVLQLRSVTNWVLGNPQENFAHTFLLPTLSPNSILSVVVLVSSSLYSNSLIAFSISQSHPHQNVKPNTLARPLYLYLFHSLPPETYNSVIVIKLSV